MIDDFSQILKRVRFDDVPHLQRQRKLRRMERLLNAIADRFPEVHRVNQVQQKHVKWVIEHWFAENELSVRTNQEYRCALTTLLEAMGRASPSWLKQVGLTNSGPGGRPRKAKVIRSRASGHQLTRPPRRPPSSVRRPIRTGGKTG